MKKLAITIGDPAGIGPEVVVKALFYLLSSGTQFIPVVIGDRIVIDESLKLTGRKLEFKLVSEKDILDISSPQVYLIAPELLREFRKAIPTPEGGHASVEYIRIATALAMKGHVHGIVTAPISKASLKAAGYSWPGHTEMLKDLTGADDVAMSFYAPPGKNSRYALRLVLTTIHVPLRDVPSLVTEERVYKTIIFANTGARSFGIKDPRIGVAGLNPHASEDGLFGDEEKRITAAIQRAVSQGIKAYGPVPPDIIFYKSLQGEFDIIVSMYHDQGLAPLKLIAFERAVNITLGLPIIRTSPDHGTAYDIAWKGVANPSSMMEAIKVALLLGNPEALLLHGGIRSNSPVNP